MKNIIVFVVLFLSIIRYGNVRGQENHIKIGYLKSVKSAECFNNLPLGVNDEQVIVVNPINKDITNKIIEKVSFPIGKFKFYNKTDKLYKNIPMFARINVYTVENDLPGEKIFSSDPITFLISKKGNILVDISEKEIIFPKEGLCFGIEMIGKIDENGKIINNEKIFTRPILTNQSSEYYTAVSYIVATSTDGQKEYHSIDDIIKNIPDIDCPNQNYNLAIGLVIKKH